MYPRSHITHMKPQFLRLYCVLEQSVDYILNVRMIRTDRRIFMYQVEVQVQTLRVPDWISRYCQPERFVPLCSACPQYGKNWACPPGMPQGERTAGAYSFVQVIGLKVLYDDAVRIAALTSPERTGEMRRKTYGAAKKQMLHALLALEAEFPGSMTIMAGGCELCPPCARAEGKLCRHPKEMRFSYSGLGFDLGRIAEEVLGIPLLWQKQGLPEYNVAIASFLHN